MPATELRIWSDHDRRRKNEQRMARAKSEGRPACPPCGFPMSVYAVLPVCEACWSRGEVKT